jgi:hypothetical protein
MIMDDEAAAVVQATTKTMHMHDNDQDGDARRDNNNWCEYCVALWLVLVMFNSTS